MSIYRFKLDATVIELVTAFAKVHQFDLRVDYKKYWIEWCEENDLLLQTEIDRLQRLGYTGKVVDKIYKAGRYYFRNKTTEKTVPKERRTYINMSVEVIIAIDQHINDSYTKDQFTPAQGYIWFITQHQEVLLREVTQLILAHPNLQTKEINLKIKKTYKNRYFIISKII